METTIPSLESRFPTAVIVTFRKSFHMVVTDEEVWQFVPPYRYLFMSDYLSVAKD